MTRLSTSVIIATYRRAGRLAMEIFQGALLRRGETGNNEHSYREA